MRIGIYGGTFDPPHREHGNIIRHTAEEFNLSEVIVMPGGCPPHKDPDSVTGKADRYRMAELAFSGISKARLSNYELNGDEPSYTYLTLLHLKELYQEDELFFIVGTDSLHGMKNWKRPDIIQNTAKLIAVSRPGTNAGSGGALFSSYRARDVSSRDIRVLLEFGLKTEEITPQVAAYAAGHKLYTQYAAYTGLLKKMVKPSRYLHSAYVAMCALDLAGRHGMDVNKRDIFIAATLHDIAKYTTVEQAASLGFDPAETAGLPEPVVHSYLGAFMAKRFFPDLSEDVINAVKFHTTFRAGMSPLEKLIALADGVEKTRNYPQVAALRKAAYLNIDRACLLFLQQNEANLTAEHKPVAADTVAAIKYFKEIVT